MQEIKKKIQIFIECRVSVNILVLLSQTSCLLHLLVFSFSFKMSPFTHSDLDLSVRITGVVVVESEQVSQGWHDICDFQGSTVSLSYKVAMRCTQEPEGVSRADMFSLLLVPLHGRGHPSATRASLSAGALNYAWRLGCGWLLLHTPL